MIPGLRLPRISGTGSRARTIMLALVFGASVIVATSYHLLAWSTGEPPAGLVQGIYHAVVFVGFASLWGALHDRIGTRRLAPSKTFWALALVAAGTGALSLLAMLVARPPVEPELIDPVLLLGFDLDSGVPIVLASVMKMSVLAMLQGVFAVYLLVRLRALVLVKRTRSSQRNWNLMIGLMALTGLSVAASPPQTEMNQVQTILLICALVFMVVNSFRLSWIVFLNFRRKMATAALSLLLLVILVVGQSIMSDSPLSESVVGGSYAYVQHFSMPLALFSSQAAMFGILYCLTTVLSLLFHLPTTQEFEQRAGERAAMHSLTHLVGDVFDPDRLHAAIAGSPVEAGSAQAAWLALADPDSGTLRPRIVAAHGIEPERAETLVDLDAIYGDLASQRTPIVMDQAVADHRVRARAGDGIGSLVAAPLVARDRMLGALFASKEVVMGFEKDEVETIGILAGQAALAIENARLFEEQVEKERLARELSIAREVQRRLLPQCVPVLSGVSMAASSVSAEEVGGDYYDFVRLDENRLGMIIADVSGKGTSAAFYMAEMQGIFQAVSRLAPSPAAFLHHANAALSDSLERNVFVSVIYGVLDVERETLVLARAGHCPAAVVSVSGEATYLRSGGMGLGLDRGELFRQSIAEVPIDLTPGDVYALYTDGVVETRDSSGTEYGYDRLLEVLVSNRHEDASTIHDAVIDDLKSFAHESEYDDDMTLVILKWHGLPTTDGETAAYVARASDYA